MTHRTLIVAHGEGQSSRCDALLTRILEHWPPESPAPTVRMVDHGSLALERSLAQHTTLVVGDPTLRGAKLTQLLDMLDGRCVPALVLLESRADQAETPGIMVWNADASPARIATALCTLALRQHTVQRLAHELAIAQHCQGGMHGEISRMHEEMSLAAKIQRDFMPRGTVEARGFDIAVLHQPTGYVSGDMHCVRQINDRTIGVLVADAVGHGVPAALLTMIIARSIQSAPAHVMADPGAMLDRLNVDLMAAQSGATRFVTAIYATIDTVTRVVTVSGAGHPPPLLISKSGVERVETDGPLLGVFDDASFGVTELTLAPGRTLLMYTDGFETCFPKAGADAHEIRMPTTTYVEHFARLCDPKSAASLEESMAELRGVLLEQAGSLHQADDVTAMAIAARDADTQAMRRAA
ncbi:MAG: serine/threonine-protein phosphatase [Phycisphaeraceae bacterium]|nr:serine/threonine-protein phosphatase [Phycisphaeraceae bacterium]